VLRIFGPKRDKIIRGWRILHNEELQNLYSLPNMITTIKSGRIRWTGNIARMGREGECIQGSGGKARRKETTRKT
jgi:hypothetical protein